MEQQTCVTCGKLHDVPEDHHWGPACSQRCAIVEVWEQSGPEVEVPLDAIHAAGF